MRRLTFTMTSGLAAAVLLASTAGTPVLAAPSPVDTPISIAPSDAHLSQPVRDLAQMQSPTQPGPATVGPRINPLPQRRGEAGPSQRRTRNASRVAEGNSPAPALVFDGTGNPQGCGGCTPPDPTGDVGPNHYIQMVNATKVAIFDKQGVLQTPAFNLSTLFSTGACAISDLGDPQVVYDPLANRWVLAQFKDSASPGLCFAVSTSADPLGSYFLYEFTTAQFPDYFKLGVWPSGYYVSTNESTYSAYAFDRSQMLLGLPAAGVGVDGETNFLLPADIDGTGLPSSAGGLFYTFKDDQFHGGTDRIELFELKPDFANPGNTTFTTVATFGIDPFVYTVCGFFQMDCIPQGGTTQKVDAVSEWPMQRFGYRHLADREVLVGNFTIGGGTGSAGAAIRWFELANSGAGWTLKQEGTQDPGDGLDRFMGSIAMDGNGNIALGYSASSAREFPSIRYATRTPTDPPGTLRAEQVMRTGGGSQTLSNRWGDYTAMSVDPVDERGFWYTGQYYATTSAWDWSTAIGTFTVFWPQTIQFTQPPDVAVDAGTVTLSATGGASGNPVRFTSATPEICTTTGLNGATLNPLKVGTCTITAEQAGNASYEPAAPVQRSLQITPGTQTITFPQPPDVTLDAGTVTLTATGGASGNPVRFSSATPKICETSGMNGATVTLWAVGLCTVSADQDGNTSYAPAAQVQRSFRITLAQQRQVPLDKCVVVPHRIPSVGTTKLLKKHCVTNAGRQVRVTVTGRLSSMQGESGRYWKVIRKPNGAVFLQTRGYPLRLMIRWFAAPRGNYLAFKHARLYRIGG